MQIPQIGKIAKNAEFSFIDGNLAFFCNFANFEVFALLGLLRHFFGFENIVERWELPKVGLNRLRLSG